MLGSLPYVFHAWSEMSFVKCLMAKYLTQSTSITCRDLNDFVLTVRSLMMDLEGLGPLPPGANNRILRLYQKTSNQLSENRTLDYQKNS